MSEPNATPTRADVLREYTARLNGCDPVACLDCADVVRELMADEILRLRAHRDALIRRVEAMPVAMLSRAAVLAALRDGGTDA